ncbi:MAG: EAL domain-containing protein [Gammaproteobacteria bacterium]|nr:EAL domain-containing protein [Gammaproteobacteria bacterium]
MQDIDDCLIQQNDIHFRELLTALPNVSVQGYDKNRRVIYWNKASELLYGFSEEEAMGQLLEDLIIPDFMRQGVIEAHYAWLTSGEAIPADELELKNKQGQLVPVYSSHVMLYQNTDSPEMYCVDVDLSSQRKKEKQVEFLTQYDKQTGLHNKESLFQTVKILAHQPRSEFDSRVAIFIGIDDLTQINNVYGYEQGDKVIGQLVSRLKRCIEPTDFIARYSGDVFVLLLTLNEHSDQLEHTIARLREAGRTPYRLKNDLKQVTMSAGIAVDVCDSEHDTDLLKNAETAMNHAKNMGKNQYLFYQSEFDNQLQRSYTLLSSLTSAPENDEFSLVYQPQFNQSGQVVSCEALLRWYHPLLGNISPAEFIPLAESKNKIKLIDRWVTKAAILQIKYWLQQGLDPVPVFINVSGQSLCDISFINMLSSQVNESGVPYSAIGIEITEYALISENDMLIQQIKWLQNRGVSIALDDFGTGYSSLSYLTRFPLNFIKIDKSFVTNAPDNPQDAAVMKAIFAMSDSLDMKVICEGVETQKHLEFIKSQSRHSLLQGYLFSKPIAPTEFENMITTSNSEDVIN